MSFAGSTRRAAAVAPPATPAAPAGKPPAPPVSPVGSPGCHASHAHLRPLKLQQDRVRHDWILSPRPGNRLRPLCPPLRGRGQDIELLIEHFLALACRTESKNVSFSDEAMDRLVHHTWPGNIRQLRGVIEHAVLVSSEGEVIGPEHLQLVADRDVGSFEKEMEMVERRKMEEALRQHRGSKAEAARSLRMPRTTFLAKMKRFGLA